jgi:ethanolamine utilization microcompartment shell protein EutS
MGVHIDEGIIFTKSFMFTKRPPTRTFSLVVPREIDLPTKANPPLEATIKLLGLPTKTEESGVTITPAEASLVAVQILKFFSAVTLEVLQ